MDNLLILAQDKLEEDQDGAERVIAEAARRKQVLYLNSSSSSLFFILKTSHPSIRRPA